MEQLEMKGFEPEITENFENGFNIRTVLAILFIGFIMLPASIYFFLITGGGLGGAAQWVTVILLLEIAKRSFVQLKRQELYIIYIIAGSVIGLEHLAALLIWRQYLVQSPPAQFFGLTENMPNWVVPPAGSEALMKRTFLHKDWIKPIILVISTSLLYRINMFSMGYFLFRITNDIERLPFPMAPVASEGATALAESSSRKETWRWRVFSISAMIGIIFGAFYVVIPAVTGLLMAHPLQLFPIPWVDFTTQLETVLPSGLFGFATDLGVILTGFVLPFPVVVGTFIGSFFCKTFGNPLLKKVGIIKNWQPGMTAVPANVVTTMDFWINVTIGTGIVVGIIGIWRVIRAFSSFKGKTRQQVIIPSDRGDYPISFALGIWFLSTILYLIITKILIPNFPVWIFILFGIILTPFLSYTSARMFGITGVATGIAFPMLREATFILSGYKGVEIWYAPIPYFNHGHTAQAFKQLELTRTRFTSWYKGEFTAFGITLIATFLFWQIIWRMNPIPSSTYPYVQKIWPMNATFEALWATSTLPTGEKWMIKAIKAKYILSSTFISFIIYGLFSILKIPLGTFYGIVGGITTLPHYAFPMFIGALFGRFYMAKKIGPNWRRYTPIILAGYSCGMGLVGMISIAIALIAKTIFQIIY
ncbi:MAG: OPT/YSL family transporter [Candidatus Omnitrophica bacterium]|nr:OPT/YSL family transporter [Candidatus Omnitrophota bacterium]MCM8803133.1 OPT/YSL family transporter [Candidatus Omnitrophota bacterium]